MKYCCTSHTTHTYSFSLFHYPTRDLQRRPRPVGAGNHYLQSSLWTKWPECRKNPRPVVYVYEFFFSYLRPTVAIVWLLISYGEWVTEEFGQKLVAITAWFLFVHVWYNFIITKNKTYHSYNVSITSYNWTCACLLQL